MERRRGPRHGGDGDDDETTPLVLRGKGSTKPTTVTVLTRIATLAVFMVLLVTCVFDASTFDASTAPRRRFAAQGNIFKKGLKTVSSGVNGLADAFTKTGNAAWDKAQSLSKDARKTVGRDLTSALQSGHQEIFKQYNEASGWSQQAANQVAQEAKDLGDDVVKTAEMIAEFFMGLKCDIGVNDLKDTFNDIKKSVGSNSLTTMYDMVTGSPQKFFNNMDDLACQAMWDMSGFSQIASVMEAFIKLAKDKCPLVVKGSSKPAFTMGFSAAAEAVGAGSTAGASGEVGLGIDLDGEKFCYAGGCVYKGFTFDVPQVGVDFNVVVSGWKSMSSVPGRSNMMAFGLGVELPDSVIPEFDIDLTLVTGGAKMSSILGVSKAFGVGQDTSEVPVTGSFAKGTCETPWCITYEGGSCAGDPGDGRDFKCYVSRHSSFRLGAPFAGQTVQDRWDYYDPKSESGKKMRDEIKSNDNVYPVYDGCEFGDAEMECYYDEFYSKDHPKHYNDLVKKVNKESCKGFTTAECAKNREERIIEKKVRAAMDSFFADKGGWKNEPTSFAKCGI